MGPPDVCGALDLGTWREDSGTAEWKETLGGPEDARTICLLRQRTRTGWALAGQSFLERLAGELGRKMQPLLVGRPPSPREGGYKYSCTIIILLTEYNERNNLGPADLKVVLAANPHLWLAY